MLLEIGSLTTASPKAASDALSAFLERHPRLFVLTGAGISTGSGIPDYRDAEGEWKRPPPVRFHDFIHQPRTRRRYWARSLVGWPWFAAAKPNECHAALAAWEKQGRIAHLVTQNVDRLHQRAGSRGVTDLHGRLDNVICLDCGEHFSRESVQDWLVGKNPGYMDLKARVGPDGDAALVDRVRDDFRVPVCDACGGMLKPDVVFFGETVPRERVESTVGALHQADALLVIGSSLMVYSGFRYCRIAAEHGIPIASVNPGRTRADGLLTIRVNARFEDVLAGL